jgi:SAM-dependent methyltransferase
MLQKPFYPLIRKRAFSIAQSLKEELEDNTSVLDFGCGDMLIGSFLAEMKSVDITSVDVVDSSLCDEKPILYPPGKLPFADNSFDQSLCLFVLHHSDDPEFYLSELKRVTKKEIIILEDVAKNRFQKQTMKLFDYVGNRIESSSIDVPFNFKSDAEWKEVFASLGLEITTQRDYTTHFLSPVFTPHKLYIVGRSSTKKRKNERAQRT